MVVHVDAAAPAAALRGLRQELAERHQYGRAADCCNRLQEISSRDARELVRFHRDAAATNTAKGFSGIVVLAPSP